MKTERLRVVLDTNAILSSVSEKSPYHIVWQELLSGMYDSFVSTEILLEYEEKLTFNINVATAEVTLKILLLLPNVFLQNVYYHFPLIERDPDDDKFIDCAFACNANYLVSNERHYDVLKHVEFPKITVIKVEEFVDLLKQIKSGAIGFS